MEVVLDGNPRFRTEHILAYEAGSRAQPNGRLSIDVVAFYNRYTNLETLEPGAPFFQPSPAPARFVFLNIFQNEMYGSTAGGEISANLKMTDRWTLAPSYALLKMHLHTELTSQDAVAVPNFEGSNPEHQAQLRSHVELSHGLAWDAAAYFVSSVPFQQVALYTRLDTQLSWRAMERLEVTLVGQNLVHDHHFESRDIFTLVNSSLVKRSAYAKITWHFR